MYDIALTIVIIPLAAIGTAVLLGGMQTLIDWLDELSEKRQERRKQKQEIKRIEFDIMVWTEIAKDYDSITQAEDKGYAIARLVLLHHELEDLKGRKITWIKNTKATAFSENRRTTLKKK